MIVSPLSEFLCPLCDLPLEVDLSSMVCGNGHCFDVSKQGYVNLLPVQNKRSKSPGDSKDMVQSRNAFLNAGHYQPIAEKINGLILENIKANLPENVFSIIDAGCGEGYYLTKLAERCSEDVSSKQVNLCGLDISKWAVQTASKRHKSVQWLVASNKALPVADNSIDLILCAFGFPSYPAFAKAIRSGGTLLLVNTYEQHLIEMRELLYPSIKPFQLPTHAEAETAGFELQKSERLTFQSVIPHDDIEKLLGMTPHGHRAPKEGINKVLANEQLKLTIDLNFRMLTKS